jgi:hypothetical protein
MLSGYTKASKKKKRKLYIKIMQPAVMKLTGKKVTPQYLLLSTFF